MANLNDIIRRTSSMVDTSGSYPSPAIQMVATNVGPGVYTQSTDVTDESNLLSGRISLGIIAAFVVGAIAFYVYTNNIQGGG